MVAQFDPNALDFENMTERQRRTLDYLRGIANRGTRGIGTSGFTGEDINTAGEILEEAPTMLERGYGPKEFNPQQRYTQRYQMRSGPTSGDEEAAQPFADLQQNVALGNMRSTLPYESSVSPDFVREPGGGEAAGTD